jgi:flagellar export protein FliJ
LVEKEKNQRNMAKKFNFRLEPVLRIRTHYVELAKEALAEAINERVAKEAEIDSQQNYRDSLLNITIKSRKAEELQAESNHKIYVNEEIKRLAEEKINMEEIEAFRRNKLTDAMKQEKILVKLKEKKQVIYNEEINKEETKVIDEIAQRKFEGLKV